MEFYHVSMFHEKRKHILLINVYTYMAHMFIISDLKTKKIYIQYVRFNIVPITFLSKVHFYSVLSRHLFQTPLHQRDGHPNFSLRPMNHPRTVCMHLFIYLHY
jgi:hypothetical protein